MLYAHANEVVQSGVLGDVKHIRALWHRNNVRPNPDPATRARTAACSIAGSPIIPRGGRRALEARIRQLGYKNMEELVRWRLYKRTGGGLMAELGSHQLDACSIFLGKKHPLAVTAVGGTNFYQDDRECEDHVYCIYEFPGKNYDVRQRRLAQERHRHRHLFVDQHQRLRAVWRMRHGHEGHADRRRRSKTPICTASRAARPK